MPRSEYLQEQHQAARAAHFFQSIFNNIAVTDPEFWQRYARVNQLRDGVYQTKRRSRVDVTICAQDRIFWFMNTWYGAETPRTKLYVKSEDWDGHYNQIGTSDEPGDILCHVEPHELLGLWHFSRHIRQYAKHPSINPVAYPDSDWMKDQLAKISAA